MYERQKKSKGKAIELNVGEKVWRSPLKILFRTFVIIYKPDSAWVKFKTYLVYILKLYLCCADANLNI